MCKRESIPVQQGYKFEKLEEKNLYYLHSPWLQSAAFALLAFASTTVDSSLMISLKIFTSKGMLVHRSGSVREKHKVNVVNLLTSLNVCNSINEATQSHTTTQPYVVE